MATLASYDAEIVVFDERTSILEGAIDLPRTIIVRFKSRADALAWYESPEYRAVLPLRLAATEGFAMLVDGYDPPAAVTDDSIAAARN